MHVRTVTADHLPNSQPLEGEVIWTHSEDVFNFDPHNFVNCRLGLGIVTKKA